jgi:hypothetical protein
VASGADHPSASFQAVLASLQPRDRAERQSRSRNKPFETPYLADGERTFGFIASAERAFEEFMPDEPCSGLPPSDAADAIASELALSTIDNPAGLRRLRRRFMWANHPDRRQDLPRDLSDRRVAIANMLIDQALKAIRP